MKKCWYLFILGLIAGFISNFSVFAADKGNFLTVPTTNNGKPWRIGYYEGGEYIDYQSTVIATVNGLIGLGWIEKIEIPTQEGTQTKDLWKWLSTNIKSKYIKFVSDAHYSANWDKELRKKIAEEIINRLTTKKDIDLMIAAGTWAGQDLANDKHQTPTIVVSTSDPIQANIIKSIDDSGYDHIHARVDPKRFERQLILFHEFVKFKTLGVAYENTDTGRVYGAIDQVEKIAKQRGFEVVSCYTQSDTADRKIAEDSVKNCFEELGKKGLPIYVTIQSGINKNTIPDLVAIAHKYRIPTFSQAGTEQVKYGFLMSVARVGFRANGVFHAETIAKVFNGAKPRQIDQVFESPYKIAINQKTADIIKFQIPIEFAEVIDEVYKEISLPEK